MDHRDRSDRRSERTVREQLDARGPSRWVRESFTLRRMSQRDIALFGVALLVIALLAAAWLST
jgi:hypothetical protein